MTSKLSIRNVKKVYQKKKHAGIGLFKRNFPFHNRSSALTANGEVTAVQHFNLEVEDGEFVVLLGKSGCGKSTLLRMIAGLEEVSEGEIWMDGENITDVYPEDREIAMVFQNYSLYAHLSVYDNIAFPLKAQHVPLDEVRKRVKNIAELLELEDVLDKIPKELSGGQQQRVAIGRALIRQPKLFLLDEPFSNLDPLLRRKLRLYLRELHNKLGMTFLYVTHDQTEAMTLGTKIVLMRDGMLQQIVSSEELSKMYAEENTEEFTGAL